MGESAGAVFVEEQQEGDTLAVASRRALEGSNGPFHAICRFCTMLSNSPKQINDGLNDGPVKSHPIKRS